MNRLAFVRRALPVAAALIVTLAACAPITPPTAAPSSVEQAPAPPAPSAFADADITLTHVALPVTSAIAMATRTGDTSLYFANQQGQVFRWDPSSPGVVTTILDISPIVVCCGERGLLGMTFNPTGDRLYVHFSLEPFGHTLVAEYPFTGGLINPAPRRDVLLVIQPEANHNGGSLLFHPIDGYLYLALGDGGGANDGFNGGIGMYSPGHAPEGNGQNPNSLLGKIIRIDPADPDGNGPLTYTIPPTNPFLGNSSARDEIWSFGLRNPFRMSFDRSNGDLWIGDVGQGQREEVDFVAANDPDHPGGAGANFGWNRREGDIAGPDQLRRKGSGFGWDGRAEGLTLDFESSLFIQPVLAPTHGTPFNCAIIGGYVYRGTAITDLIGAYVFTDNCNDAIRGFPANPVNAGAVRDLDPGTPGSWASFGEDNAGELYVLSLASGVYRIDPD